MFAELSARYPRVEDVEVVVEKLGLSSHPIPRQALFLAAKAFQTYRQRGGSKTGVLPDFFIGAHAAVEDVPLLTRDPDRIKTYFPMVTLIAP